MVMSEEMAFRASVTLNKFLFSTCVINKNVLGWSLLITCKEHILQHLQTFLVETIPHCVFE